MTKKIKTFRLLTEEQARAAVTAPRTRRVNQDLARLFNVTIATIRACRTGRTWKFLLPLRPDHTKGPTRERLRENHRNYLARLRVNGRIAERLRKERQRKKLKDS